MNTIHKAIASIMKDVEPIGKNKKNQQQGFMYRGIDDMYNDLQPKFSKHGVFITSEVLELSREERQSQKGGLLLWTVLKVRFTFYAEDGSSVASVMIGEAMDSGDKGANKAMSIALKYCLMQLFLIPTEELKQNDNDGHVSDPAAKQNGTTLHNHKQLGTEEKPLITNVQFKKLMERVRGGDTAAGITAMKTFSFEDTQLKLLKEELTQPA